MKWIDKILEYLGIKERYVRLVEPQTVYDLNDAILETGDTKDKSSKDRHKDNSNKTYTYEGQTIDFIQIGGHGNKMYMGGSENREHKNTRTNKNAEAQEFEQRLRQGLDLGDIHRQQAETGRKYTIINDEHYNNRNENAKININGGKILNSQIDLDEVNINDAELRNASVYRSSEQDQGMDL